MARTARWIALGVGAAFVLLAVVLAVSLGDDPTNTGPQRLDREAPPIDNPTLDGGHVTSADLAGRSVIVNFWNTWCIPCRRELPALAEFYGRHRDDPDFVMLGIVRDDTEDAVRDYVEEKGMDWTIVLDPDGRAALDWSTFGQPETYAISPDGIIVGMQLGEVGVDDLETMLARARGLA